MKILRNILAIAAVLTTAQASCCVSLSTTSIDSSTKTFNIAASSSTSLGKYQVKIQYPNEYIVSQNVPSVCTQTAFNAYTCTGDASKLFTLEWKVLSAGGFTSPAHFTSFSVFDEPCTQQSLCALDSTVSTGSTTATSSGSGSNAISGSGDNTNGMVHLGALGSVSGSTFYPILAGFIICVVGLAVLFFMRSKYYTRGKTAEEQEIANASNGNGSGWFGEKKVNNKSYKPEEIDLEKANPNGYAPFCASNPERNVVRKPSARKHNSSSSKKTLVDLSSGLGSGVGDNRASMIPQGSLVLPETKPHRKHKIVSDESASEKERKSRENTLPRADLKKVVDKKHTSSDSSSTTSSEDEAEMKRKVVQKRPVDRPSKSHAHREKSSGDHHKKSSRSKHIPKKPLVEF